MTPDPLQLEDALPPEPAGNSSSSPTTVGAAIVCCFGSRSLDRLIPKEDWRNQGIEIFRRDFGGFEEDEDCFFGDVGGCVVDLEDARKSSLLPPSDAAPLGDEVSDTRDISTANR